MRIRRALVFLLLPFVAVPLFGTDLSLLDPGRTVRLIRVGQGLLCEAKVVSPSPTVVALKLSGSTAACGAKFNQIYISAADVTELVPERRLTGGRVVAKILLGAAGVATLAAVPLTSSDPESRMILGNFAIPGTVLYVAWRAIPRGLDYLVILTCSDHQRCFSTVDPRLGTPD
jgi:hypothetical protein